MRTDHGIAFAKNVVGVRKVSQLQPYDYFSKLYCNNDPYHVCVYCLFQIGYTQSENYHIWSISFGLRQRNQEQCQCDIKWNP